MSAVYTRCTVCGDLEVADRLLPEGTRCGRCGTGRRIVARDLDEQERLRAEESALARWRKHLGRD